MQNVMEKLTSQHATRHASCGRTIGGKVMQGREIKRGKIKECEMVTMYVLCELLVETGENEWNAMSSAGADDVGNL